MINKSRPQEFWGELNNALYPWRQRLENPTRNEVLQELPGPLNEFVRTATLHIKSQAALDEGQEAFLILIQITAIEAEFFAELRDEDSTLRAMKQAVLRLGTLLNELNDPTREIGRLNHAAFGRSSCSQHL
jgi:hypothetical protein